MSDLFLVQMRQLSEELARRGMPEAAQEAAEVVKIIEVGNDRISMRLARLFPLQDAVRSNKADEIAQAHTDYMSKWRAAGRHIKPAVKRKQAESDDND